MEQPKKEIDKVIIDKFEQEKLMALHNLQFTFEVDECIHWIEKSATTYFSSKLFRENGRREDMADEVYCYNRLLEFFYDIKSITDRSGSSFSKIEQVYEE